MRKRKQHTQRTVVVLLFLIIAIGLSVILPDGSQPDLSDRMHKTILSAASNPGRLIIYAFNGKDYDREVIDVGYTLVYTVVQGYARNDGKNRIYIGVSNDYFRRPYGCAVLEYEKSGNAWAANVVDNVGDVRCKDLIIGDADNDGKNELVLGTHGDGLINIYKWDAGRMKWNSMNVEQNWVAKIDAERGTNHRVPRENLTYDAVDQTAVHIVIIGDADNDGKNELVATISSSLAYEAGSQISFVNIYKWNGSGWDTETASESSGYQHRSILIGDVDSDGGNEVVVGTSNGKLIMFKKGDGEWKEFIIDREAVEKNMKGVDYNYLYSKNQKTLVLATGFPNAMVYSFDWNSTWFEKKVIANVSSLFGNVVLDFEYNSMEAVIGDVNGDNNNDIVVGGMGTSKAMGWMATTFGYLVVYSPKASEWEYTVLDTYPVLGMDLGGI